MFALAMPENSSGQIKYNVQARNRASLLDAASWTGIIQYECDSAGAHTIGAVTGNTDAEQDYDTLGYLSHDPAIDFYVGGAGNTRIIMSAFPTDAGTEEVVWSIDAEINCAEEQYLP